MRKYLETFRLSFKMQIVWRFDVAMTMAATAGRIIAAWILWQAIFSDRSMVMGFSLQSMLSYYILCSIFSSIDFSHQISGEVSYLIQNGRFSGHMVTPINPFYFFYSMTQGESAFHLFFSIIAAAACALLFGITPAISGSALQILLAVAIIPVGLFFMAAYHYLVGIMAFKFIEIGFFMHVQSSIIAFATGSMVPLSLLPAGVLAVFRFLPFTHVIYTPVMLLCGNMSAEEGLLSLGILAAWTLAIYFLSQFSYRHLRTKYDGVGI